MAPEKTLSLIDSIAKTVSVLVKINEGGLELTDIRYAPELVSNASGLIVNPADIIAEFSAADGDGKKAILVALGEMALKVAEELKDLLAANKAA